MIDPFSEAVLSLNNAARLLPARSDGKKVHLSTTYRWTTIGCRGVILESIQIGGTRYTSKEALTRFFRKLSQTASSRDAEPAVEAQRRRQEAIERANMELDRAGF